MFYLLLLQKDVRYKYEQYQLNLFQNIITSHISVSKYERNYQLNYIKNNK